MARTMRTCRMPDPALDAMAAKFTRSPSPLQFPPSPAESPMSRVTSLMFNPKPSKLHAKGSELGTKLNPVDLTSPPPSPVKNSKSPVKNPKSPKSIPETPEHRSIPTSDIDRDSDREDWTEEAISGGETTESDFEHPPGVVRTLGFTPQRPRPQRPSRFTDQDQPQPVEAARVVGRKRERVPPSLEELYVKHEKRLVKVARMAERKMADACRLDAFALRVEDDLFPKFSTTFTEVTKKIHATKYDLTREDNSKISNIYDLVVGEYEAKQEVGVAEAVMAFKLAASKFGVHPTRINFITKGIKEAIEFEKHEMGTTYFDGSDLNDEEQ